MITITTKKGTCGTTIITYEEVRCLSTDTKPTEGIHNGSTLIEIDTGKKFLFDEVASAWNEITGSALINARGVDF